MTVGSRNSQRLCHAFAWQVSDSRTVVETANAAVVSSAFALRCCWVVHFLIGLEVNLALGTGTEMQASTTRRISDRGAEENNRQDSNGDKDE